MLIRGQGEPSAMAAGTAAEPVVHGHPVRPCGGGGSSSRPGQRIAYDNGPASLMLESHSQSSTPPIRRLARAARGRLRDLSVAARTARAQLEREARLRAAVAGLLAPELAILECRRGADESGLFSEFAAVIGFLEHYELWMKGYAGVRVRFDSGLYFEPEVGPNWWDYYFEPIRAGESAGVTHVVDPYFHDLCANRVERTLPKAAAAKLVARYVTPSTAVREEVDRFVEQHWPRGPVIGLHYRGTDKYEDAPRVPYEAAEHSVREAAAAAGSDDWAVFVATDEAGLIDFMASRFKERLIYRRMFRSADGRPIDVYNPETNYQKGLHAVVDCLLLARSRVLIRTASNLSLCAALFNPQAPEIVLSRER